MTLGLIKVDTKKVCSAKNSFLWIHSGFKCKMNIFVLSNLLGLNLETRKEKEWLECCMKSTPEDQL